MRGLAYPEAGLAQPQEALINIQDRLRRLADKAEDLGAEHKEQLEQAIQKAEEAADRQTGGQYHEQIAKAGDKADAYVETLKNDPAVTEPGPSVNPTEPGPGTAAR